MTNFYFFAVVLILFALVLAALPWLKNRNTKHRDVLSNTLLIKQRMVELAREENEGLLSEQDRQQSETELKLALLDEVKDDTEGESSVKVPLVVGFLISIVVAGGVYFQSNQIQEVNNWQTAIERLPELGKRIVAEGDSTIQAKDLQDFALGLRSKLSEQPDDATGWMLLGRVFSSVNRFNSATQAFNKSLQIAPNSTATLISYSQALMMQGEESSIQQAKVLLQRLLRLEPDNSNAVGMLAVVAAKLGDKQLAIQNWQRLKTFVEESDPNYRLIEQRIAELSMEANSEVLPDETAQTVITINIALDKMLDGKLPQDGYLFVFAQDATGAVRMPAAVVKTKLSELPISIELSDANAMMPNYKLSQLTEARLVARISGDEDVATATGELQGEIVVTIQAGTSSQQQITIDEELM
ncbi:MAG: cytochrome c-type biogenesis protein CcmI [Paraglaciecola sp.]